MLAGNGDDEDHVQAMSSRKGRNAEKCETKLDNASDDGSTLITSAKLSEKNRLKITKSIKTSEDDSSLIHRKKDKKRNKEVKRIKTSDEDSSSSHRKTSPLSRDKNETEKQDCSKNAECGMSQSKCLDNDDGKHHKTVYTSLVGESNSGHKSSAAVASLGNKLSKKNVEEVLTNEELRLK